ncbi:MAG: LPS assembly protein LptD [Pseudomonadota bacterium]
MTVPAPFVSRLGLLCLLSVPAQAVAIECVVPAPELPPVASGPAAGTTTPFSATADALSGEPEGVLALEGDVRLQYQDTVLRTERALLDTQTLRVSSTGKTAIHTPGLVVSADGFDAQLDNDELSVSGARFELPTPTRYLRGESKTLVVGEDKRVALTDASVTSCPPDQRVWNLRASSIELDPDNDTGTARDVRFEVGGVPLMYLPWLSWPLSDARKTGFLYPRIGNSDNRGFELSVPWYWNIRPNVDATFTPRLMSKRGLQLRSEFRYLTRSSNWQLRYDILDDRDFGDVRRHVELNQKGRPFANVRTEVAFGDVSDPDYLKDLSARASIANIIHIDRRLDVHYQLDSLAGLLRVQSYQTLDDDLAAADRPYSRLPQLLLGGTLWEPPGPLRLTLNSELVNLKRDDSIDAVRLDLRPRLAYQQVRQWGFFSAAATLAHTRYWLQNASPDQSTRLERTVPILSLDGGVKLRRQNADGSSSTLEPRAFYLYASRVDQDDLPVFDSGLNDFSFDQLFRENRFSGRDRIGDANQLSLALRSRHTDSAGREVWRYGVGSSFYFDSRTVGLDDDDAERTRSDIVAEGVYSGIRNWQLRATAQLSPDNGELERSGIDLRYRNGHSLVNLGHRLDKGRFDQADLSFSHRIRSDMTLLGRWQYALDDNRSIEQFLGVSWESCCWAFRGGARTYLSEGTNDLSEVSLEIIFKGLGGLGNSVGQQFERAILGYQDPY